MKMVSQKQIDGFHRDGYLLLDLDVNHKLLDNIIDQTETAYPVRPGELPQNGTHLHNYWTSSIYVKKLALFPQVMLALEDIYLRRPRPFQTLNYPVGTEQAMHSDTIHFNSFPNNFMCAVMVALEDIDTENGPVCYCQGSHQLPEYNMEDVGAGTGHENHLHYENFISDKIVTLGLETDEIYLKKGQAIIWHGNLLHGGSKQKDPNRTRHSQVTHYLFEGSQYYTPILSTPDNIHSREPEWITFSGPTSYLNHARLWLRRALAR